MSATASILRADVPVTSRELLHLFPSKPLRQTAVGMDEKIALGTHTVKRQGLDRPYSGTTRIFLHQERRVRKHSPPTRAFIPAAHRGRRCNPAPLRGWISANENFIIPGNASPKVVSAGRGRGSLTMRCHFKSPLSSGSMDRKSSASRSRSAEVKALMAASISATVLTLVAI